MNTARDEVWAVIPVKSFARAKQRLAGVLAMEQRALLATAMLEDVLDAACAADTLAGVAIVTGHRQAAELAIARGLRVIHDPAESGHSAAVRLGAEALIRDGVATFITFPGDLPTLHARDIDAVVRHHRDSHAMVTLVPAYDGDGTNAVVATPPDRLPFHFGPGSFALHLAAARAAGMEPRILESAGLGLDVDTPVDLAAALCCRASSGRWLQRLREWDVSPGLAAGPRVESAARPGNADR